MCHKLFKSRISLTLIRGARKGHLYVTPFSLLPSSARRERLAPLLFSVTDSENLKA
jgi:hypothetical protein